MKSFIAAIIFSLFLTASAAYAFTMTDGGSYILEGIITDGGNFSSGGSYKMIDAAAQPVIGNISDKTLFSEGKYRMCLGAFCTYMFEPGYSVRLSGNLKYDDGSIVSNGDAWAEIEYMTMRFVGGKGKTDSSGNFNVRVAIPEYLYNKNFDIKVYASGKIDAMYECTFSQSTGVCS